MINTDKATLGFEAQSLPGIVVLRIVGPLTLFTLENAEKDIDVLLSKCQGKKLVVDLSQSPYVSSTGWSFFLQCHARLRAMGGKLLLAGMNSDVFMGFELLDFVQFIRYFPNVASALSFCQTLSAAGVHGEVPQAVTDQVRRPQKGWRALIPARRRTTGGY
jgi:anti-anti-sigma factor